jgi:hypothetical protein
MVADSALLLVGHRGVAQEMFNKVRGVGRACIPSRTAWVSGYHNPDTVPASEGLALPPSSIVLDKRFYEFTGANFCTNPSPGSAPKAEDNFDIQGIDDALVKRPARVRKLVFAILQVDLARGANENQVARRNMSGITIKSAQ